MLLKITEKSKRKSTRLRNMKIRKSKFYKIEENDVILELMSSFEAIYVIFGSQYTLDLFLK